jgi:hypothetical protein
LLAVIGLKDENVENCIASLLNIFPVVIFGLLELELNNTIVLSAVNTLVKASAR